MIINCIWEHNENSTLLYAENFTGAFSRGKTREIALQKMPNEIISYLKWCGKSAPKTLVPKIVQEKLSDLNIADADTDVIFNSEKEVISEKEYLELKALVLKSAEDFLTLYNSVPNKHLSFLPHRKTFYGDVPRTAAEMYEHTKNVNSYYWGEIGIKTDDAGTIVECRKKGFEELEKHSGYLSNKVFNGSYGEQWSLKKVLRRFIWHDRIHAKAMFRMALNIFGTDNVSNPFKFEK